MVHCRPCCDDYCGGNAVCTSRSQLHHCCVFFTTSALKKPGMCLQALTADATDSLNAEYQQLAVNFAEEYPDASVGLADVNSFLLDVAAAPAALVRPSMHV